MRAAGCAMRRLRRFELSETYDIAVVGSGFAGSLLAMIARRLGRSVILIEKGTHPRVVIGESSTPLSNLLLEELTSRYGLTALAPLTKWGSWQRSYPDIGCGLKRGFTFHHHVLGAPRPADLNAETSCWWLRALAMKSPIRIGIVPTSTTFLFERRKDSVWITWTELP